MTVLIALYMLVVINDIVQHANLVLQGSEAWVCKKTCDWTIGRMSPLWLSGVVITTFDAFWLLPLRVEAFGFPRAICHWAWQRKKTGQNSMAVSGSPKRWYGLYNPPEGKI